MKRFYLLILVTFLATSVTHAADDSRDADREALKVILVDIQNALNVMDMDALLQPLAENVTISFMNTDVAIGKEQVRSYYDKMFVGKNAPLKKSSTIASIDAPAVFQGDTAVAHGKAEDTYVIKNGDTYQFSTRWTATINKSADDWKVISLNFSINPLDNVILDELEMHLWVYTVIAFFAGIALALIAINFRRAS